MSEPQPFDWVTARAGCSLSATFSELRLGVEADVAMVKSLRIRDENATIFNFKNVHPTRFAVQRIDEGAVTTVDVSFTLDSHGIFVRDEASGTEFQAVPRLGRDGKCRLVVKAEELELWQVRQKALEHLFFYTSRL